jgi:hypothetical protein
MARIVLLSRPTWARESVRDLFASEKGDRTDHLNVFEHGFEHVEGRVPTESQENIDGFRRDKMVEEIFAKVWAKRFGEIDGHVVFGGVRDCRVRNRSWKYGGIDGFSGRRAHDKVSDGVSLDVQVDLVEGERSVETEQMCEYVDIQEAVPVDAVFHALSPDGLANTFSHSFILGARIFSNTGRLIK